jgi:hypothetical protein
MTKDEFTELMLALDLDTPMGGGQRKCDQAKIDTYWEILGDLPGEDIRRAFALARKEGECDWFPTTGKLYKLSKPDPVMELQRRRQREIDARRDEEERERTEVNLSLDQQYKDFNPKQRAYVDAIIEDKKKNRPPNWTDLDCQRSAVQAYNARRMAKVVKDRWAGKITTQGRGDV